MNLIGDVTRDDSQRRFLAQQSAATLVQCCNHSKQCRNNVSKLCFAKNCRCESSRVTSPYGVTITRPGRRRDGGGATQASLGQLCAAKGFNPWSFVATGIKIVGTEKINKTSSVLFINVVYYWNFLRWHVADSGNYSSALQCYLEAGAVSSSFFNLPVPANVWDDQVRLLRAMLNIKAWLTNC